MITVTQKDLAPELVAHARRGPCAVPTPEEKFAYLLTRRAPSDRRPNIQEDATAAVLSYQRRLLSVKQNFLVRHKRTPLGVTVAYWDRIEAQTRQALHGHVLTWSKRRMISGTEYVPRPTITEQQARRWDASQQANMNAEDDVYYRTETARVHAELVRLDLSVALRHPRETLLWAFLCRAVQTLLYIHACTPIYCLKSRALCRFFFGGQSNRTNSTARRLSVWRFGDGTLRTISSSCRTIWSSPSSALPLSTSCPSIISEEQTRLGSMLASTPASRNRGSTWRPQEAKPVP